MKKIAAKTLNFVKIHKKQLIVCFAFLLISGGIESYAFWEEAIAGAGKFVKAIGIGLGIWGIIKLMEGYGNDNPSAKNQGIKQLDAGGAIYFLIHGLLNQLKNVFTA